MREVDLHFGFKLNDIDIEIAARELDSGKIEELL